MSVRHSLAVLGLVAGALVATPAFAGEGHPLPPMPEGPRAEAPGPVTAYSLEERAAWLATCHDRLGDAGGDGFCEDYLDRYEASFAGPGVGPGPGFGPDGPGGPGHPGMRGPHGAMYGAGYGYGYGYYGGRVMWVPVKISGGCNCGCAPKEEVVEEIIEQPAPPPARRVIRDKRIKIQPAAPTKYTKTKYVK